MPPKGLPAKVTLTYNQREDSQPQNFGFFNISPKWTLNWLSYVQDDPASPGMKVVRYLPGGGAFYYAGYNAATGAFTPQDDDASVLTLMPGSKVTYRRFLQDGSVEIYAQSDGGTTYPRQVFLSEVIDPQGNALSLSYDAQLRLVALTDATGRKTRFTYGQAGKPLLVTRITDPFGRFATLGYDGSGRLNAITDVLGLTSRFTYDASSLVNTMTTPYGTTHFAYGTNNNARFLQITDPLGNNEREEWLQPAPIAATEPAVPRGVDATNEYLQYRDSFHWDGHAYVVAGCTPAGKCNYADARITHFHHDSTDINFEATSVESIKYPLENRIWFAYSGQRSSIFGGAYDLPIRAGRVLDDATTQLSQFTYNPFGNLTQEIDPAGRMTEIAYAANQIDITAITRAAATGPAAIAQFTYNTRHRPLTYTDAAGQTTHFTYNAAGQLTSLTNPLGEKTSYFYNSLGYLTKIVNADGKRAASFTYDKFDRVATFTDSEGWTVGYDYDAADRPLLIALSQAHPYLATTLHSQSDLSARFG